MWSWDLDAVALFKARAAHVDGPLFHSEALGCLGWAVLLEDGNKVCVRTQGMAQAVLMVRLQTELDGAIYASETAEAPQPI